MQSNVAAQSLYSVSLSGTRASIEVDAFRIFVPNPITTIRLKEGDVVEYRDCEGMSDEAVVQEATKMFALAVKRRETEPAILSQESANFDQWYKSIVEWIKYLIGEEVRPDKFRLITGETLTSYPLFYKGCNSKDAAQAAISHMNLE